MYNLLEALAWLMVGLSFFRIVLLFWQVHNTPSVFLELGRYDSVAQILRGSALVLTTVVFWLLLGGAP